ncbi:MAG TPA: hypothetical protein VK689_23795 [Armatimonadota bacterium]|nr:hypothetical protein [Armatimonadota bacterium]
MQDLTGLYPVLQEYRLRHNGRLPSSSRELDSRVVSKFRSTGFTQSSGEGKDSPFAKWPVTIMDRRLDGTPVGGPKPPGTRDLWAVRFLPQMNGEPAPKAVALWEDGEVAIQAPDTMIQVPRAGTSFTIGFTGQAGVSQGERIRVQ